jgi:hypothetical protein
VDTFLRTRYGQSIAAPPAAIAVSIEPAAPAPALVDVLLDACSEGVRPRRCEPFDPRSRGAPDARVTWESDTVARVDVGAGAHATERVLQFRPEDRDGDRFRAVGLVVGALASDLASEPLPARTDAPRPPAAPRGSPRAWLSGGALVGTGLRGGAERWGGWARVGFRFSDLPVAVTLAGGYAGSSVAATASAPSDHVLRATVGFTPLSLGLAASFAVEAWHLAVRPRVDGVLLRQTAESAGPPASSGSRWVDGVELGAGLVWPANAPVSLIAEGAATFLSGGTAVRIGNDKIASFPAHALSLLVGLEVPFGR